MPSEEEQQPGPSGVSQEELASPSGLNVTNEEEAVEEEEEDLSYNQTLDNFERQRAFQTQLLEQSGGGIDPETPVGTFEFDLDPYVNRTSARMGARERHFTARLRQTGNFIDTPHIVQALQDALRRAMTRALNEIPNLHDDDRLFFTISSNRLSRGDFNGWGVRVREWREDGDRVDALLNRLSRALNSNEQFEMDDSFQMSIIHVQRPPQGTGSKPPLKSKKRKHGGKAKKTVSISPEQFNQLKREQREAKNAREQREARNAREKAIYEENLLILQNMHEWIFGDTTSLTLALRAVRRRDLDGIAKLAQTSDEFFDLCERCGLFTIEPDLREKAIAVPCTSDAFDTD